MKKLFAIVLTLCMLASAFCMTAFAADEPPANPVLTLSALEKDSKDGKPVKIMDYDNFEEGWTAAMELATSSKRMQAGGYVRVVVDLLTDWTADDGEFTSDILNDAGFSWDTICFESGVKMTLNLNGHTIKRGLTSSEFHGEVMYVESEADVIINNGTITGGFSDTGAGGIHVCDGASVTLNNVDVIDNVAEDDDGAGIALYGKAVLKMEGGSISNNKLLYDNALIALYGSGIYAENSYVYLKNVTLQNNQGTRAKDQGAVIYAKNSVVDIRECKVIGNGKKIDSDGTKGLQSVIHALSGSEISITDTIFTDNGHNEPIEIDKKIAGHEIPTALLVITKSELIMGGCNFTDNKSIYMLYLTDAEVTINECDFTNNTSHAIYGHAKYGTTNEITKCKFDRSVKAGRGQNTFHFDRKDSCLTFRECNFGRATFNERGSADIGSIFGNGSLTMVVAFVALIAAVASLAVNLTSHKKGRSAEGTDEDDE